MTPLSCQDGELVPAGADCAIACESGACTGQCSTDDTRCNGGVFQRCDGENRWVDEDECELVCDRVQGCVDECVENTLQCNGEQELERCSGGAFVAEETCQFLCVGDACSGECMPNTQDCQGSTARTCDAAGAWTSIDCPNACVAGQCVACSPGSERCGQGVVERCDATGTGWTSLTVCETADTSCTPCDIGGDCENDDDCATNHCVDQICRPPEDCSNGEDDDQNGDVDCADSACAASAYRCVAAPEGWNGPVARWRGSGNPPSCGGDYAATAYTGQGGLEPGSASCGACSCGALTCGITFSLFNTPCTSTATYRQETAVLGMCYQPTFSPQGYQIARTTADQADDVPCPPSGGAITRSTPAFAESARLCSLTATGLGGCSGAAVCSPPTSGAYDAELCVWRVGSSQCPAGFANGATYHTGYDDTRACSACSCNGSCGTLTYTWFSNTNCATQYQTGTVPTSFPACANPTAPRSARFTNAASCLPSGGALSGSVTGTDPVTVCCEG
jgi:hypothetical protein